MGGAEGVEVSFVAWVVDNAIALGSVASGALAWLGFRKAAAVAKAVGVEVDHLGRVVKAPPKKPARKR